MKKIRGSSTENSQSEENPNSMKFDRKFTKWRKSELSKENNRSHWKSPCPTIAWVHVTEISNRRYYHVSNYRMGALCIWRIISDNIYPHPNHPHHHQYIRTSRLFSQHHVFEPGKTRCIVSLWSESLHEISGHQQNCSGDSAFPARARTCVP